MLALAASVLVGQPGGLFTMLAWTTALTVPSLTLVFPAACAICARAPTGLTLALVADDAAANTAASAPPGPTHFRAPVDLAQSAGHEPRPLLGRSQRAIAWIVLAVGVCASAGCFYAAVGRSVNATVRGPTTIGCPGWMIYQSDAWRREGHSHN